MLIPGDKTYSVGDILHVLGNGVQIAITKIGTYPSVKQIFQNGQPTRSVVRKIVE